MATACGRALSWANSLYGPKPTNDRRGAHSPRAKSIYYLSLGRQLCVRRYFEELASHRRKAEIIELCKGLSSNQCRRVCASIKQKGFAKRCSLTRLGFGLNCALTCIITLVCPAFCRKSWSKILALTNLLAAIWTIYNSMVREDKFVVKLAPKQKDA